MTNFIIIFFILSFVAKLLNFVFNNSNKRSFYYIGLDLVLMHYMLELVAVTIKY